MAACHGGTVFLTFFNVFLIAKGVRGYYNVRTPSWENLEYKFNVLSEFTGWREPAAQSQGIAALRGSSLRRGDRHAEDF